VKLRIGGRGSKLSLIQMEEVVSLIKDRYPSVEIEFIKIKTRGDVDRKSRYTNWELGGPSRRWSIKR